MKAFNYNSNIFLFNRKSLSENYKYNGKQSKVFNYLSKFRLNRMFLSMAKSIKKNRK